MVQINFGQREVSCKVVFYGPGMSGKTTNLEIIHKKAPKDAVGEMVSIATETDRTLYFDFLPLDLGQVAGMRTKFQLYTVPGQIYYNATRKLVLQGVDGVIFVADSNPDKMNENLESLQNLRDNLAEMGLKIEDVPLVLQYNKRDLPNALSVADINIQLNPMGAPTFEGVAREGKGVFATLKEISRLVIEKLNKDHAPAANRRRTATSMTPQQQPSLPAQPAPVPALALAAPQAPAAYQAPLSGTPMHGTPVRQPAVAAPAARPAPAAAPPPRAPTPARSPGYSPTAPTPAHGTAPAPEERSAKEKHLAKAKPPSLSNRPANGATPDLGRTDPNLQKYKQQTQQPASGGALRTLSMIVLLLILGIIILAVLVIFVQPIQDAVRPHLPPGMQRLLVPDEPTPAPPFLPSAPTIAPRAAPVATTPAGGAAPAPAPAVVTTPPAVPGTTTTPPVAQPSVAPETTVEPVPVSPPAPPATPAEPSATPAAPPTAEPPHGQ